jgi:RHS repeat-associated protein
MREENRQLYYYHGDHLGSAQMVTKYDGEIYEQLEYTPYGELWVEHVPVIETTPFRFTGKERDGETGLYYFGARYLNPQTGMWLSADPAMGEYIPQAPINDEAKQHNKELPGMGGVFNYVNLHVYHYAGNNPVKLIDPDGKILLHPLALAVGAGIGAVVSVGVVAVGDIANGKLSSLSTYGGAAVGGAAAGIVLTVTGNSYYAGIAGGAVGNLVKQGLEKVTGDRESFSLGELALNTGIGAATGLIPGQKVAGVTTGRGSMVAVASQVEKKLANGTITNITANTAVKAATGRAVKGALLEGTIASAGASALIDSAKNGSPPSGNYPVSPFLRSATANPVNPSRPYPVSSSLYSSTGL